MANNCRGENISNFNQIFMGIFIILGLLISYTPQLLKLGREKDSTGISSLFLLVGFIGTSSTLGNLFILQSHELACCATVSKPSHLRCPFSFAFRIHLESHKCLFSFLAFHLCPFLIVTLGFTSSSCTFLLPLGSQIEILS